MPGYRMALLDPDGSEVEEGEISIGLHPPPTGLMSGYIDNPALSTELLGGNFYRTSDVARRDKDGYFWYVGRTDDVFKSSDYRISPFELESLLIEHETVAEAAVVPSPDPIRLGVPKAFVMLKPGIPPTRETALSILRFARERLAPFKRIRRLEFGDLPKTISGKIRRVQLRGLEEERRRKNERGTNEYWEEDFPELKG
jgi:acetyl-CoA synthetase